RPHHPGCDRFAPVPHFLQPVIDCVADEPQGGALAIAWPEDRRLLAVPEGPAKASQVAPALGGRVSDLRKVINALVSLPAYHRAELGPGVAALLVHPAQELHPAMMRLPFLERFALLRAEHLVCPQPAVGVREPEERVLATIQVCKRKKQASFLRQR